MNSDIYREKSPLSNEDCFVVFDRRKSSFTFPVHVHPEYELNYVEGAEGARRVIGDSLETIGEKDLVLIANPDLKHAWKDGEQGFTKSPSSFTLPSLSRILIKDNSAAFPQGCPRRGFRKGHRRKSTAPAAYIDPGAGKRRVLFRNEAFYPAA